MSRLATPARVSVPVFSSDQSSAARTSRLPLFFLALASLGYAVLFGWLSLEQYWAFQSHALDLGNMAQAAWNTLHGHPFFYTNMRLPYDIEAWRTTTRLSFHVEALFPLISLAYLAYPHAESLLLLQTAALALGAIPIYLLACDILGSAWLALAFACAYLLSPSLEGMNLYEFHPVALATPLLLFAFLFARRGRYLPFALCCLAAMGTKEEIGLIVAMFGLYVLLVKRNGPVGVSTVVVGAGWSLFAALVVEHHFRQPGSVSYLHTRYGYLGHGLRGVVQTVAHDPAIFFKVLFTWPKAGYLQFLLAPTGYFALLAFPALLLGAPTFALNLLSVDPHMYSGLGDNSAELISVVMIAAVLGAGYPVALLQSRLPVGPLRLALGTYILIAALWAQHAHGFTTLGAAWDLPKVGNHQVLADGFTRMVPPSVPVATQDQLDPHLSNRHDVYLFPDTGRANFGAPALEPANTILLDVSAPTYPLPSGQIHDFAERWIHTPGWGIAAARDGLILIRRGATRRIPPSSFYTYAYADPRRIGRRLSATVSHLRLLGYGVERVDLSNHRVPNLAYSIYLQPQSQLRRALQPVIYEVIDGKVINVAFKPLGLDWFPTTRWRRDHRYVVRMDPIETQTDRSGTATFWLELRPAIPPGHLNDSGLGAQLWKHHGKLWPVGSLQITSLG